MTTKLTNFVALFLLAVVTDVFWGNMVYADTVDRNFFASGIHSHRQNDYCKRGVTDEDPYAGLYSFYASYASISLALSGEEVAGIFSQRGRRVFSSSLRC